MESTNLHHHQHGQLQDHEEQQLVVSSNNSSLAWMSPNLLLNNGNIHANSEEVGANSLTSSMMQDLGFLNWPNSTSIEQYASHHDQHHLISNKIKQESSTSLDHHHHNPNFPKLSDMLISPSSTSPSEMLLLKSTISSTYKNHMLNKKGDHLQISAFQPCLHYPNNNIDRNIHSSLEGSKGMTNFTQIFPSVNISSLSNNSNNNKTSTHSLSSRSSTMEMNNLQSGLDLFNTARLLSGGSLISQPTPFGLDHDLQQSNDLKLWSNANNLSSFNNNGVPAESKRHCCISQPNSTHQMTSKKPRFESRVSCPPLKVRKEKLGDRIAALQQLVAPFGKTDTASVLMEAIGYIKFLQNQVETLSVPYMKLSSRNKSTNNAQRVSDEDCESEDAKQDLRRRGLCLVPVSCMSYLATDAGNGGVWPPQSFNPSF